MRMTIISLALVGAMFGHGWFTQGLNEGLQDEKSYTRHAMENYRKNPEAFRESKNVLETWSRSDYIALAVAQQKKAGKWAKASDKLGFLESKLQQDVNGRPFCVIQQDDYVAVLSIRSAEALNCSNGLIKGVNIERIKSGDMEFSGRSDYWIYVLRLPGEKQR